MFIVVSMSARHSLAKLSNSFLNWLATSDGFAHVAPQCRPHDYEERSSNPAVEVSAFGPCTLRHRERFILSAIRPVLTRHPSISARRQTNMLAKASCEMALVGKPRGNGNLRKRQIGVCHQG